MLKVRKLWRLTISYWPRAAEAGVKPVHADKAPTFLAEGPQYHIPHGFDFDHPPTREDFVAVVNSLPWAHGCWNDTLLPLLEKNQWPFIDPAHKGSTVELHDGDLHVGELRVWRDYVYENKAYDCRMIEVGHMDAAMKGVPKKDQNDAHHCLMVNENAVREKIVNHYYHHDENTNYYPSDGMIVYWLQQVLHEHKFRKSKPKQPASMMHTA